MIGRLSKNCGPIYCAVVDCLQSVWVVRNIVYHCILKRP